jgi:transposase
MKRKRTYGTVEVERFDVLAVLSLLTAGCIIAVDVAKTRFVAAVASVAGEVLRLIRFEHPRQTASFLRLVEALQEAKLAPRVVMEPTGTYGDALRYQCHKRGVTVEMMSPKHAHNFAVVLDGVPSMHDPKAAVTLAQLAAIKPAKTWQPESERKRDVRALLDRRSPLSKTRALYHGHLEAMLARHWPEFGRLIDVHEQRSWMKLLLEYPGPQAVAAASEAAAQTLRKASRGRFDAERIAAIANSARLTLGVPMTPGEQARLRAIVQQIEQQTLLLDAVDEELVKVVKSDDVMTRLAVVVGPACAAAIVCYLGSPLDFGSARAMEKAAGLNLKERSSGEKKGRLSITKYGPGEVRQLLYLATLRILQEQPVVSAWYRARRCYRSDASKAQAVVAVMRKLTRSLWHVARGARFDATKLFDVRRLDLPVSGDAPTSRPFQARKATLGAVPNQGGVVQQPA